MFKHVVMVCSDVPAGRGVGVEDSVCSEDIPFQVPQAPGGKCLASFKNQHLHSIKEQNNHASFSSSIFTSTAASSFSSPPVEAYPSSPSGGSERSVLPAGGLHLLQKPHLPGGTVCVRACVRACVRNNMRVCWCV